MPSKALPIETLSLEDARANQMERATTLALVAIPLGGNRAVSAGLRGFLHCLCVQDSPDNPCPCTGPIIWISAGDIVSEVPAGRKDREGRELTRVVARRDTRLIVERTRSVRADAYLRATTRRARRGSQPPRVLTKEDGSAGSALLDAFRAGYEFGQWLDDMTGGAISDAGAEVIEDVVSAATEPWEGFLNQ